jgi:hypothetical protein
MPGSVHVCQLAVIPTPALFEELSSLDMIEGSPKMRAYHAHPSGIPTKQGPYVFVIPSGVEESLARQSSRMLNRFRDPSTSQDDK